MKFTQEQISRAMELLQAGKTPEQIAEIFAVEEEAKKKKSNGKSRQHDPCQVHEYILMTEQRCCTCETVSRQYFKMVANSRNELRPAQLLQPTKPDQEKIEVVSTCSHCKDVLCNKPKEWLIAKLLKREMFCVDVTERLSKKSNGKLQPFYPKPSVKKEIAL